MAKRWLTEGLEVFDGHKLGLWSERALKSGVCKESGMRDLISRRKDERSQERGKRKKSGMVVEESV